MADEVIDDEKKSRGSLVGCLGWFWVIFTIACWVLFGWVAVDIIKSFLGPSSPPRVRMSVDPNSPRPIPEDEYPPAIAMKFKEEIRGWLLDPDEYKTNSVPLWRTHPKGRVYLQDFTTKNKFGGPARFVAALVYATNRAERAWTFYSPDEISDLLKELKELKDVEAFVEAFKEVK